MQYRTEGGRERGGYSSPFGRVESAWTTVPRIMLNQTVGRSVARMGSGADVALTWQKIKPVHRLQHSVCLTFAPGLRLVPVVSGFINHVQLLWLSRQREVRLSPHSLDLHPLRPPTFSSARSYDWDKKRNRSLRRCERFQYTLGCPLEYPISFINPSHWRMQNYNKSNVLSIGRLKKNFPCKSMQINAS